jgi:hypothetical protein
MYCDVVANCKVKSSVYVGDSAVGLNVNVTKLPDGGYIPVISADIKGEELAKRSGFEELREIKNLSSVGSVILSILNGGGVGSCIVIAVELLIDNVLQANVPNLGPCCSDIG